GIEILGIEILGIEILGIEILGIVIPGNIDRVDIRKHLLLSSGCFFYRRIMPFYGGITPLAGRGGVLPILLSRKRVCELCLGQKAGVFRPKLDLGAKKMTQVD
ncbi:MAG: hypothetical protein II044_00915, partial [Lachnospiraceae bacterium]|nr:hypothetical protein [Lachnospiraceae bacterium]